MSLSHLVVLYMLMLPGHRGAGSPFDLTVWEWLGIALFVLAALGIFVWEGWLRHGEMPFLGKISDRSKKSR